LDTHAFPPVVREVVFRSGRSAVRKRSRKSTKPQMDGGKIELENVNSPGRTVRVDASKYQAMRHSFLKVLPRKPPGLTSAEIEERILPLLPEDLFPKGAKAGWWKKGVQLDLEAKGLVDREPTKPLRWHKR
jgi:hypothetical protein